MSSTSETGHAKTVANFEDLISFCTGYGATYNPSKAALKTAAMTTLLASANTSLQAVKTAKTAYDNATNAREVAFLPLRPLATRIIAKPKIIYHFGLGYKPPGNKKGAEAPSLHS